MDTLATVISTSLLVWFIYCLYSGYKNPNKHTPISDHFDLGYVRDCNANKDLRVLFKIQEDAEPKKSSKPKKPRTDPRLIRDCASALVSLGMSRTASKQDAKEFLSKNSHITTVEVFLTEYFSQLN